ncbi:hypothetical protein THAOC_02556 [Thalassiosira oceanica]|uniref:Uncharacterized protein n=1 Tax=Thalassiosira oceanica TaxID=159749 RepID=K0TAJ1_THAOC|nr:hypothetical protein THAOC_02556 [Thalassiosira oceanica]|eukprot:EJK75713.1 hypothetical protein THAOC_02556 [Thalassiosira oceanica]
MCKLRLGETSHTVAEQLSVLTADELRAAADRRTNNSDGTTPADTILKKMVTSCKPMGHSPQAAQAARCNFLAMSDYLGIGSLFVTLSPCDLKSFHVIDACVKFGCQVLAPSARRLGDDKALLANDEVFCYFRGLLGKDCVRVVRMQGQMKQLFQSCGNNPVIDALQEAHNDERNACVDNADKSPESVQEESDIVDGDQESEVTSTFCDGDYGDNCYGDSHNDRNEGDDITPEANDKDQEDVLNNQHLQGLDTKYGVDNYGDESLGIDEEADEDGRQSNAVTVPISLTLCLAMYMRVANPSFRRGDFILRARKSKHGAKLAAKNFGQKVVAELTAPCLPPKIQHEKIKINARSSDLNPSQDPGDPPPLAGLALARALAQNPTKADRT